MLLVELAEFDARKLYLPDGYPSMFSYCVEHLRFSEDEACKRIRVARAAREFPVLLAAPVEGRLHLTGVVLLVPHLRAENVDELVAAATHQSKAAIEQLLVGRFPRSEMLSLVQALPASEPPHQSQVGTPREPSAPGRMKEPALTPTIAPIAQKRYAIQVTVGKQTHDLLRQARELLSHQIPSGDLAAVLEKVIAVGVRQLEKRKSAADHPRPHRPNTSADPRHIPADVKRAVWERDGGQCTFTSECGHRCSTRQRLEFDHVEEIACGGRSTVANLRLRWRAHNRFSAARRFGEGFMHEKRQTAAEARARAVTAPAASRAGEVIPWPRSLGCRTEEARRGAETVCGELPGAALEDLVKLGISYFGRSPRYANEGRVPATSRDGGSLMGLRAVRRTGNGPSDIRGGPESAPFAGGFSNRGLELSARVARDDERASRCPEPAAS